MLLAPHARLFKPVCVACDTLHTPGLRVATVAVHDEGDVAWHGTAAQCSAHQLLPTTQQRVLRGVATAAFLNRQAGCGDRCRRRHSAELCECPRCARDWTSEHEEKSMMFLYRFTPTKQAREQLGGVQSCEQ